MNDLTVTVSGWVATDPKLHVGKSGVHFTSFRLASTPRYYHRSEQKWVDGQTEWFSVRVFRGASLTVMESIKKGQPVIVQGKLHTHEWESDNGTRHEFQIDAAALGHDLTRGTATFVRAIGDTSLDADEPDDHPDVDVAESGDDVAPEANEPETEPALSA